MKLPSIIKLVFNRFFFQKIFALVLLIAIVYSLKGFAFLFLATFLFAYLFLNFGEFLSDNLNKYAVKKIYNNKIRNFFEHLLSINSIVLFLYLFFIGLIIFAVSDLLPKVIQELTELPKNFPFLSNQVQVKEILDKLKLIINLKQDITGTLQTFLSGSNYEILVNLLYKIQAAGTFLIELFVALILSYIFVVDRKKIKLYLEEVKKGNFAFLYNEYEVYFTKISNGFGLIFKAQSLISVVNTALTVFGLYFIALFHGYTTFPYILTLAIITFIFGMIPVLGMFLSAIPIMMIGFSFGMQFGSGLTVVVECLLLVTIIHMIEAYYLNPRIVSSYAELPISLTFLILVISEQVFGFAGLLVGIPLFYILIDFLKDFDIYLGKVKKAHEGINFLQRETKKSISNDIRLSRSGKKGV